MDATTQTESIDSPLQQNQRFNCPQCKRSLHTPSALARHTKDKHPSKPQHELSSSKLNQSTDSTCHKPTYKPPILEEPSCPPTYHIFWNLKAKTRRLSPNAKGYTRFVAPRFPLTTLQLAEQVNFPDLLSREFVAFAQAYDTIVKRKDFASTTTVCQYPIGITNAKQDLVLTGRCRILKDLERKAPSLPTKNLKILTPSIIQSFFAEARIFLLFHGIPWDDFPSYFMTASVLGAEISCKVTNVLHGYPADNRYLVRNFSCFIERIILGLLPLQESYYDAELRILKKHKQHLTALNPSIEYTKTHIHSDAQELTTKSPYFKQVQSDITEDHRSQMVENQKINLLNKILSHTPYDAKIHKLLIASAKYKDIADVPSNELLDTLGYLMVAEKKSSIALLNAAQLPCSSSPQNSRPIRTQSSESTECRTTPLNRQQHSSQQPYSPRLLSNTPSLMLPPPNFFNRPPPTYLNVPPPNYFGAPPPSLMSGPPPNVSERVGLDH